MKQYINIILIAALVYGLISCEDFLTEKEMPRVTIDFYGTQQGADAAAIAAYSYMRYGLGGERSIYFTELGTDLFTHGEDGGQSAGAFNLYDNNMNPSYFTLYEYWENLYKGIATANLASQALREGSLPEKDKNEAIAEMLFVRAYFYFDLVQQFGRIPLVIEASYEVRTDFSRASVAEVYNQIIEDLTFASDNLPEIPKAVGRATRYAASHLLAKVYLTRGSAVTDERGQQPDDMENALLYARRVIDSGRHTLMSNFSDLWKMANEMNQEVIFAVQFTNELVYNESGNTLHLYFGSWYEDQVGMVRDIENGRPYRRFNATNKVMLNLFDRKNDSRYYKSFKWAYYANRQNDKLELGDTAIYYSLNPPVQEYRYKYFTWDRENRENNRRYFPPLVKHFDNTRLTVAQEASSRDWVRIRLAETYLIAAEAAGRKGDLATAVSYINVVRQRAAWQDGETKMPQYWREEGGIPGDTNSTYDLIKVSEDDLRINFVDFILDERARELLGEVCRWEDLVRCEKLLEYVKKYNPDAAVNIQSYHKLRPIPQNHIDRLNPQGLDSEEQNEGYY
ncbi:MAG: RagB/SusD family nutrient uptake outer membrane protein [Tannerellaceae bacterium]|jgi:hypothetical protein|nr:RagB/SusD family nutrient uptake outer membrane protein [Tannerellaceae bacterium]